MLTPERVIPVVGLLVFVGAIVLLLWGEQLGAYEWARQVPQWVLIGLLVGGLVFAWRMRKRRL